jgi:bifunctional non-homologous end joining protein LigD
MPATSTIKVNGREVGVSNLQKVLFPGNRFTKGQVIDYYVRISPYLLPHLKDRPVTLVRFPDGVLGESFYEKNAPGFSPKWIKTVPIARKEGGRTNYILINDLPTLVWVGNLAALELHPFLHRAQKIEKPTHIAFDLDPGEGTNVLTCAEVAFHLKQLLDQLGLQCFPKVSGSKGLQVYVPLNTTVTYEQTSAFARTLAELLTEKHPDLVLFKMAKILRRKKVFIDWSQNNQKKTTVAVYSLRAKKERPYVSMPVTWDELKAAMRKKDVESLMFEPEAALKRVEKLGDLFEPVLMLKQKLPANFLKQLQKAEPPATENGDKSSHDTKPSKKLKTYAAKRNFSLTSEPGPKVPKQQKNGALRFVVQKHAATRLHYDFRLELDGVLKSWAVPKGVPLKKGEIRGAFETEDHPLEYLDFEGTIPKGQYGGGTVMVWDIGTYETMDGNYYKGDITFRLSGKKLQGEWTLRRFKQENGKASWLLIKREKNARPISAKQEDMSVLTRRTMDRIAQGHSAVWQSNRSVSENVSARARFNLKKRRTSLRRKTTANT